MSRLLNNVPRVNATAGMHDVFQVSFGGGYLRDVLNVPGMPVAAIITYSSLAGDAIRQSGPIFNIQSKENEKNRETKFYGSF